MNQANDTLLHAFPTEIVCRIFELSITTSCGVLHPASTADSDSNVTPSARFSPLHLGAISKAWRNIAWSTPRLWSSIVIELDSKVFTTSAGYEIAEGWFQRSGCLLPLGIRIYQRDPLPGPYPLEDSHYQIAYARGDPRPTLDQKSRVLDLVNSYSHRWRFLDLELPRYLIGRIHSEKQAGPDDAVNNPSGDRVQLEVLRIFEIYSSYIERGDPLAQKPRLFSEHHAPLVLNLMNETFGIGRMEGIEWTKVVILRVGMIEIKQLLTIISNAPRLEELEVRRDLFRLGRRPDAPDDVKLGPYTHQSLRKIALKTDIIKGLDVLRQVTMPSLISIDLTMDLDVKPSTQDYPAKIAARLAEFFERSQPPLSGFALEIPDISIPDTLTILRALPPSDALTNLTLRRCLMEPQLWTGVFDHFGSPSCGGQIPFRNLRAMTFEHMAFELTFQLWDIIADALQNALSGPSAVAPFLKDLQQLTIIYPKCQDPSHTTFEVKQETVVKLAALIEQDRLPLRFMAKRRYHKRSHVFQLGRPNP